MRGACCLLGLLEAATHPSLPFPPPRLTTHPPTCHHPSPPPQWAAVQGHTEVARCLLDFGAALDGTEWEMGRTALYMAAGRGHVAFVDLLLSRGANPALRRAGGRTPLGIAAYNGHTEVVRLLLRHPHADLDGRDDQGCTPLWQAARNGRTASLKLLLAAGADPSVPGEQGWLAIDVAREKDRVECVALLEVRDALSVCGSGGWGMGVWGAGEEMGVWRGLELSLCGYACMHVHTHTR